METAAHPAEETIGRRFRNVAPKSLMAIFSALFLADPVLAADKFMGESVQPANGMWVAKQDATVRESPKNDAKRVATLRRSERVEVVGKLPYGWLAVRKDGEDLGFVFAQAMLPLIDGEIDQALTGSLAASKDVACTYSAGFTGKSSVEDELFETSDYEIFYRCKVAGKTLDVSAFMFITEAPYQLSEVPDYQISIDLPQVGAGDEIVSAVFVYRRDKSELAFDSVTLAEFGKKPTTSSKPAGSVANALRAAVELAPSAWNDNVWKALSQK